MQYCLPVIYGARSDELASQQRKLGKPHGERNKSKSPPPPIKAAVAIWNSHTKSLDKSVEEGQ
jgi:hypothetical protein